MQTNGIQVWLPDIVPGMQSKTDFAAIMHPARCVRRSNFPPAALSLEARAVSFGRDRDERSLPVQCPPL
jgi:hypothetical protein